MKNTSLCLAFASALLFTQCKKEEVAPPPPPQTSLKITATDLTGKNVPGATVLVYNSQSNFLLESNAVATATTDVNGQATIPNLSSARYWFLIKIGCSNNVNSNTSTASAIALHQTSQIATTLNSTGTLRYTNNSQHPYRIYVNGVVVGDLLGGRTLENKYMLIGTYTIRVLQLSGHLITPTDITYSGTLSCGGTLITTFP